MLTSVARRMIFAGIAGATAIGLAAGPAFATTKPVTRLAGSDRIGTSIAISNQEFPAAHSAKNVILTAAYTFADAMSAGPLGKLLTAPLLLTPPAALDAATLTEIERVLPVPVPNTPGTTTMGCTTPAPADAVYVIGGDVAIAATVDTSLNAAGFRTLAPMTRGFGATRFLSPSTRRTGNAAILAIDAIEMLDALRIEHVCVAGHDWGSNLSLIHI